MSKYRAKPRDEKGARKGTTAAAVNRVMSGKWQTAEQIAEKVRRRRKAVIRRLYHGLEKGIYEHQKIIRFRMKRK